MSRKRKHQRWGVPADRREPLGARIALLLILVNLFLWIGLRNLPILVINLASLAIAISGMFLGHRTVKRIARHGGRISGENMAMIGYWGNLLLFLGSLFLFSYLLVAGLLQGDLP